MSLSKLPSRGLETGAVEAAMSTPFGMRNRIINGDMRIDQRNNGSAVTLNAGNSYAVDRFSSVNSGSATITAQRSTTAPVGFINSLVETITTGASASSGAVVRVLQGIEGYNTGDMKWGTADAQEATLSFWVRSSLTGTFGGCVQSGSSTGNYVFQYTVNSANTWEKKTITVDGPTIGTFYSNNDMGIQITWDLGSGSNFEATPNIWTTAINKWRASGNVKLSETTGATWYVTGVQLEVGSVATEFERRHYTTELDLCMRYFQNLGNVQFQMWNHNIADTGGTRIQTVALATPMRTDPSYSYDDNAGNSQRLRAEYPNSTSATNISFSMMGGNRFITGFKYPYGELYGSNGSNQGILIAFNLKLSAEL